MAEPRWFDPLRRSIVDFRLTPIRSLAIAFVFAVPANRWLISRGKGHAAVHRTGIHGGPSPRLVGAITLAAFVFGSVVLIGEALD